MPDENSVAPIERVNLKYQSRADGGEDVEIPFKLMVVSDFSFGSNPQSLAERKPIDVNKHNFNDVMKARNIAVKVNVPDRMSGVKDAELQVSLKVETLKDLTPEGIVAQVPEMQRQLQLARALQEVKADLANPKKLEALRAQINKVLSDTETRKKLDELRNLQKNSPSR